LISCAILTRDLNAEKSAVKIAKVQEDGSTLAIFYSQGKFEACQYKNLNLNIASCKPTKVAKMDSYPKEFLLNSKYGTYSLPLTERTLNQYRQDALIYNIVIPTEGSMKLGYNLSKEYSITSAFESADALFEISDVYSYSSMHKTSLDYSRIIFDSSMLEDFEGESITFKVQLEAEFELDPEVLTPQKVIKSFDVTVINGLGPTDSSFSNESYLMYPGKEYKIRVPRSQIRANNP